MRSREVPGTCFSAKKTLVVEARLLCSNKMFSCLVVLNLHPFLMFLTRLNVLSQELVARSAFSVVDFRLMDPRNGPGYESYVWSQLK